MNKIGFYLIYPFIHLLSRLPLRVLFVFSDVLFLVAYFVIGYRKDVVRDNLSKSFPEKSKKELRNIERKFYLHLCDSFVEWIFPLHRSGAEMEKYYRFLNPELLNELHAEGKGIVGVLGHYGNWEYLSTLPRFINHKVWAIYKKQKNPQFNKLITQLRSKYGVNMMTNKESIRRLITEARSGEITMTYFLADQSPMRGEIKYWTSFLNRETGVYLGAEQVARKLDMAVVFMDIRKIKRGRYEVEFKLLSKNPRENPEYEITEMHVRALENRIKAEPSWWLWSHRRWKHKPSKPEEAHL
ncbi:MAG TPA: lysophospholipid acyltransferase family protein [Cryomorphaceae bacterium]|nr:lysophospholipid acyltransferase family protein [Cryomorphaceae bacterium]